MTSALFNIASFSLAVGLLASCAVFAVRFLGIRKDLQENEAHMLFKQAMSAEAQQERAAAEIRSRELSGLEARLADAGLAVSPRAWRALQLSLIHI